MINKLKSIYFYLLYKVNKLKSAKIVCLEMVRLLCSEIWVFAFVGWRYVPSPPVLSRVNNNVMLIICHTVQHKIDFYLWNFKSTIRRMCLFMFWCWACHKTESTDLPFEYEHVCHGVGPSSENLKSELRAPYSISNIIFPPRQSNSNWTILREALTNQQI